MNNWVITAKKADFKSLAKRLNIDQVTARILVNRGVDEDKMQSFLRPRLSDMHSPSMLKDADKAAAEIKKAIDEGLKIRVVGDYDVDGIFSTYIFVSAIRECGGDVDYAIPHRIHDGYGMNESMSEAANESGIGLIVTCDNGIAAIPAITLAKKYGIKVVVTDHHEIPFEIQGEKKIYKFPPADVVVDPHREDDEYPFEGICGAMVAFKVSTLLYEAFGLDTDKATEDYLEMVSFATICDIMELKDENRTAVYFGLNKLSSTGNAGLAAIINQTGLNGKKIDAYHVGFILGPCFNASGRLDSADLGLELLLEKDEKKAVAKAAEIASLNEQRKMLTEEGMKMALDNLEGKEISDVLVVYLPKLHESLCGIVAGRLKEKYYRPTFVLCDGENEVKGSGRSIPGYSMYDKMNEISDVFIKFGGHPMAAGLSIPADKVDEFNRRLNENAHIEPEFLVKKMVIDVPMPLSYLTKERINELSILEPFGNGNEKPVFADKDIKLYKMSSMGKNKEHRRLFFELPEGGRMEGVYFRNGPEMDEYLKKLHGEDAFEAVRLGHGNIIMQIIYYPNINTYGKNESIQVLISEYR
ncbi:MAG: single-stranded-DNA-specific exonuclease RecJ [Lachnospiraceae bacterium]|nr:single-stranded-DNA-specific exonuclease RecJ [Lachnospiraceae bacterium]